MRYGVTVFATDRTMRPDDLAVEVEARGFHSLYLPEHTHIPVSRRTPPPGGEPELPDEYRRTLDPWIALAMAGARTRTLRLGSGVALVAQHDPIALAKQLATLDHLTEGRVVLGAGFGWNYEEMEDHGVDPRVRREVVREHVLAMQALWSPEPTGFAGSFVKLAPSWAWPKPARIPVLLGGGAGPKLFAAIAEYGDGWIPVGGAGLRDALPRLREVWAAAGRDASRLDVVTFGTLPNAGKLAHYAALGVTEVVLRLPPEGRDEVLRALDEFAALVI